MSHVPTPNPAGLLTVLPDDLAETRVVGLTPASAALVARAGAALDAGDYTQAWQAASAARAQAPDHPEPLRLLAVVAARTGRAAEAVAALRRVLELRPDDTFAANDLGDALRAAGDLDAAYVEWRGACARRPDSVAAWYNLACNLDRDRRPGEARTALERALALAPGLVAARLMLADLLLGAGEFERAAVEYRTTLAQAPEFGEAWCGLANIRSERFAAAEIARMEQLDRRDDLDAQAHAALEFALAKAYDDEARIADAFATYARANARMRRLRPWDARAFDAHVDEVIAAFGPAVACADDAALGREVIFIVGMPRSGSTLVEQILASHGEVEGADELPDLMQVIREESARRALAFPHWVTAATPADWTRLGRRYLELTARWRRHKPRFSDKQPFNWLLAAAAQAMLPAARIIDCRRDVLETCWSCYAQAFPEGPAFSYDFADIAAFLRAEQRAMHAWIRGGAAVHVQVYEDLLADPEAQIRALLEFCGLEFDAACLQPERTQRTVATTSAAQVRQPIRRAPTHAQRYGELLAPLRAALNRA